MARRLVLALAALSALPGCGVGVIVYGGSLQAARGTIGEVLAETRPGIDQDRAAACVMKGLTRTEAVTLGLGDSTGPTPAYRAKVAEALTRPGVAECVDAVPVQGAS
jgi:hypothetical protein